ncbi:hypothetical protein [Paenibacillus sp. 1001270B_150601_E10]|uniref:hypothetical protein n=1 Tax=Paenibacillus sp. 1001270B_150601_E10 TaxID=2787079 RepID=UPI0018A05D5F|nr:hypothetical protein [Paenibacillus sp. 1001270B_150601_E10]
MERWWLRARYAVKSVIFPLICLQFIRTLLFPTGFDVLLLFVLFLLYLGILFDVF